jgi:hypothetical protein
MIRAHQRVQEAGHQASLMPGMGQGRAGSEGERQEGQGGQGKAGQGHRGLSGIKPIPS